jgi:integrase
MAWIEKRGTRDPHWRVVWREGDVRVYEKFPNPEQAELYRTLVAANGERRVQLPLPAPVAADPLVPTPDWTFERWARFWIDTYSGPRPMTLARYRSIIERDFIPAFGDVKIGAMTRQQDGAWVLAMQDAGVAPKTMHNKHGLLHQIMQAAVDFDPEPLRSRNPITAKLPKVLNDETRFLTAVEFARLEAAMHPHYQPFLRFLVGTGVRFAEATGLKVGRVHLLAELPVVDIAQSWQQQPDNSWAMSPLKTKSAKRQLRLDPVQIDDLIPLTAPHLEAQEFVFRTITGKPIRHSSFWTHYWAPAVHAAGLDGLRPHDLRHTNAAWLIAASVPMLMISRRLGHASITITMDLYGHLMPELDAAAADAIGRALSRTLA